MSTTKFFFQFLKNHTLLTILMIVIAFSLQSLLKLLLPSSTIAIFGFFYLVVAGIHYGLLKANEKKAGQFVRFFMVATFAKLFIYIVFLFLLVMANRDQSTAIIILFFILYLVYTVFEIISFLGQLSNPE